MPNQKGSAIVIFIIIILLLLIGGSIYFLFLKKPSSSFSATSQSTSTDPITNHITFTKPDTWNNRPLSDNDHLIFASNDLTITVTKITETTNQAIDAALHPTGEQASYNSDIQQTTVSGLKAVSYHNNYEGHDKTWVIAQEPNTVIEIHISSKDQATEDLHKTEIDSFINSISIK